MTFGEKFKAEREKRNLTQQKVADSLGLNRRMITRYEHNVSFPRSRQAYKKIADYFEVDVNYLLLEDRDFTSQSDEPHDFKGIAKAQGLIDGLADLFSDSALSDKDKDAVMKAIQDIYWRSRIHSVEQSAMKNNKKDD